MEPGVIPVSLTDPVAVFIPVAILTVIRLSLDLYPVAVFINITIGIRVFIILRDGACGIVTAVCSSRPAADLYFTKEISDIAFVKTVIR